MYQLDTQAARHADTAGATIKEIGKYIGEFTQAQDIKTKKGGRGVSFIFESAGGQKANLAIYTTGASGERYQGYDALMAIMTCMQLRSIQPQPGKVTRYDYAAKKEVQEDGTLFPDLHKPIGVLLETAAATRITYVPLKGGGDVARALAAGEVDMTVNNPIEAEALWRQGKLRPLCVFDGKPLDYPAKLAGGRGWADLPTCMSVGIPAQYLMLRGIFTTPGATPEQVAFYTDLLDKLRATPDWKDFMARGAFKQTAMTGPAFADWLDKEARYHNVLMREARLKAAPGAPATAASGPAGVKK